MTTVASSKTNPVPHIVASSQAYGELTINVDAPREASEIESAMSSLVGIVSRMGESITQLGKILLPVLPNGYLERDVPPSIESRGDYSCPLASHIENQFLELAYQEDRLRNLLTNIKL